MHPFICYYHGNPGQLGRGFLCLMFLAMLAHAIPAHGQTQRDAEWYVQNPGARRAVVLACNRQPYEARSNPDCAAAWQANIIATKRETMQQGGMMDWTPPSNPRYWRDRPEERAEKLAWCDRMSPAEQANFFCDPARQAEQPAPTRRSRRQPGTPRAT